MGVEYVWSTVTAAVASARSTPPSSVVVSWSGLTVPGW
jgi:hypothetical protein